MDRVYACVEVIGPMKNFFTEGDYYNGERVVGSDSVLISDKNKMKWSATRWHGKVYKTGTIGNCVYFMEVRA